MILTFILFIVFCIAGYLLGFRDGVKYEYDTLMELINSIDEQLDKIGKKETH